MMHSPRNVLHSFKEALLTRFFLGIFEGTIQSQISGRATMILTMRLPRVAAFFPGALFMISKWFVNV